MFERTRQWLESRIGLKDIVDTHLRGFRIPGESNYLSTLGAVAFAGFLVQVLTGIFLLMYYVPHPDHAFSSLQVIDNRVPYGWLFRSIHVVGSNVILVVLFLHLLVVFYRGSYKRPREMTWLSGGLMFFFIFLFSVTGYLLSWNQVSYWSTTIITTIPTFLPVLGEYVSDFLRGGEFVSGATLGRFFAFHVAILPFIFIIFSVIHIFLVWRTGFAPDPRVATGMSGGAGEGFRRESYESSIPYYPDFLVKELFMAMVYLAVVFFIITFFPKLFQPALASVQADPQLTPEVIRPPWYFLAPYGMLKLIPNKFLGISLQLILFVVFLFWPFFDGREERNILKRPILRGTFVLAVILWIVLTLWGRYS